MYQANMYGQPSYASHPFPPPPVNPYYGASHQQYSQHPPTLVPQVSQPAPVYHVDPNTFRRDYMQSLSELTFNSRPIIQNLSMLAQEYARYADIVVSCVETHIRRVHPSFKLPAFYLLDAISKNVHEPYARRFAPVVTRLFLDTYGEVDEQTRQKMEEMLLTWRTGSPSRSEVFGAVNQIAIERGVWGDGGDLSITKGQVLSELQFAIDLKKRAVQTNQYDVDAQRKIEVLYQLRKCIMGPGVSHDELRQILGQLRDLVKTPQTQTAPPTGSWASPGFPPRAPQPPPLAVPYATEPHLYPVASYSNPQPTPQPASSSAVAVFPDTEKLNSIINSLVSAGVVSIPSASTQTASASNSKPSVNCADQDAWREYRVAILSQKSKLASLEILKVQPPVKIFLYDRLPSQCKQCGLRFPDSVIGRQQHQVHLDMHFKHNRKATQSTGRGHARASFMGADEWIHTVPGNNKGKGRADTLVQTQSGYTIQTEAELRAQFVVVPPGDEAKAISCPICKEHMKSEFLEDDEEWVWRNAVMKDEKIYHATCHAEALSSTSSLAARLRNDLMSSSRDGTPERSPSSRSTPPLNSGKSKSPTPDSKVGTKRKVEQRDSEITEGLVGTPPAKKMAMSSATLS